MSKDYYSVLGVTNTASGDEIKTAYRKLAAQHHPDKGGDTEKFQEVQEAYSTLSDAQSRARHDAELSGPQINFGAGFNFESAFDMFHTKFSHAHVNRRAQMRLTLWLTIHDVFTGGKRPVSIGTTHGNIVAEIEIPPGVQDGESLHYAGIGPGGSDIIVTFRHHVNPLWKTEGANVTTEHGVTIWECITGTQVTIKGISGESLTLTLPPTTQPGTILRLRGQGLPIRHGIGTRGDLFVKIRGRIPDGISPELLAAIQSESLPNPPSGDK
jgi:curved DNA-binding protein